MDTLASWWRKQRGDVGDRDETGSPPPIIRWWWLAIPVARKSMRLYVWVFMSGWTCRQKKRLMCRRSRG
jgi:hypothetical protein